jgi:hypothetical protein
MALARAYAWRQRRYSINSFGTRAGGGNCLNESNMAREIEELENLVEKLGGDTRSCLDRGRKMADKKEKSQ